MQYAILPPVRTGVSCDPEWMTGFARHAESTGFESIVLVEHAVVISGYQEAYPYAESGRMPLPDRCVVPDPLETLAFLAGVTSRIGLATGVLILPEHHPVVLAKRLATLDRLSNGRLRLCVGVGWMREEMEACGVDFSTRGRRADECVEVLRTLWADEGEEGAGFHGEFFTFDGAHSHPKPVQEGGVPIHVGGHSNAAARRAGRLGDGFQPLGLGGHDLEMKVGVMREAAERAGRDPDSLELTLGGTLARSGLEDVEDATAAGACRLVLSPTQTPDLAEVCEEMSAFAERVGIR